MIFLLRKPSLARAEWARSKGLKWLWAQGRFIALTAMVSNWGVEHHQMMTMMNTITLITPHSTERRVWKGRRFCVCYPGYEMLSNCPKKYCKSPEEYRKRHFPGQTFLQQKMSKKCGGAPASARLTTRPLAITGNSSAKQNAKLKFVVITFYLYRTWLYQNYHTWRRCDWVFIWFSRYHQALQVTMEDHPWVSPIFPPLPTYRSEQNSALATMACVLLWISRTRATGFYTQKYTKRQWFWVHRGRIDPVANTAVQMRRLSKQLAE